MTILEALIRLRNDLKLWVANNLRVKADKKDPIIIGTFSMNRKEGTSVINGSSTLGKECTASALCAHAEGAQTTASGGMAHAEGQNTVAKGIDSHAEGFGTIANDFQHVQGTYNIEDKQTFSHIVGNGEGDTERSNAHTLTKTGEAWYAGDVYVGSTSGTNKDAGSKKLATEVFVNEKIVYSTTDLTAGTSELTTGKIYVVYE